MANEDDTTIGEPAEPGTSASSLHWARVIVQRSVGDCKGVPTEKVTIRGLAARVLGKHRASVTMPRSPTKTMRLSRNRWCRSRTTSINGGSPDARRVLKALKLSEMRPPEPPEGEESVM